MIEIIPGRYGVDQAGVVYSLRNNAGNTRSNPKPMTPLIGTSGYYQLVLRLGPNERKLYLIHRLVASAFCPNPNNLPEVNHLDGNKLNNVALNLEWVTASGNANHAYELGLRRKFPNRRRGLTNELCMHPIQVHQRMLDGTLIQTFPSISEAERQGFSQGNISACLAGKRKTHKGCIWTVD